MRSKKHMVRGLFLLGLMLCPSVTAGDRGWSPVRYRSRTTPSTSYRPLEPEKAPPRADVSRASLPSSRIESTRPSRGAEESSTISRRASWSNPRGHRRTALPSDTRVATRTFSRPVYRGQAPDSVRPADTGGNIPLPGDPSFSVGPPADPLFGNEPYNHGVVDALPRPPAKRGFFKGGMRDFFFISEDPSRGRFQSDHAFDSVFISPISSPFLSEDPRALTEVRPLFIYQSIPDDNPAFRGGDIFYYGLQGRIAFTERFSLVLNKLGGISFNPDVSGGGFEDGSSFSEIWLGPKFTFIRNDQTNTILAGGITFQIPVGSSNAAQDTGDLGLAPYLAFAQSVNIFDVPVNFMNTTGYAFDVGGERSEYFYSNFHLDVNLFNKIFPTLEINWTHYADNGDVRNFDFEGGDLANFGSRFVEGNDLLTIAPGVRYKFSECVQIGTAVEFPLVGREDINDFRLTFDLIWRY